MTPNGSIEMYRYTPFGTDDGLKDAEISSKTTVKSSV